MRGRGEDPHWNRYVSRVDVNRRPQLSILREFAPECSLAQVGEIQRGEGPLQILEKNLSAELLVQELPQRSGTSVESIESKSSIGPTLKTSFFDVFPVFS